jgi:hypothetical protein
VIRLVPSISDADWEAILRDIGPVSPRADVSQARVEIEQAIHAFIALNVAPRHAKMLADRRVWEDIDAMLTRLHNTLVQVQRHELWTVGGYFLRDDLAALQPLRLRAHTRVEGYNIMVRAHEHNRNPAHDWLYWRVLAIWTDCLDRKLAVSTPPKGGAPYGPLVRFFTAVVTPVLGDKAPGPHAIRSIVHQERRRRIEQARQRKGILSGKK